uniref:Lipoprotein n=1 Tax=Thermodesulfobacterium geofontis TaxID=1295609 RepID=A0A7C4JSU5_9BACT
MKRFSIIFLLVFFIFSCGKKTEPLPIKESIPKGLSFEVNLTTQGAELFNFTSYKNRRRLSSK